MEQAIARFAAALRLAERAHAQYELRQKETGSKELEWPEFYAQFLLDNAHLWSGIHICHNGSCEIDDHA